MLLRFATCFVTFLLFLSEITLADKTSFEFTTPAQKNIRVWIYTPQALHAQTPILFVIHGVNRDAERYLDEWSPIAEQHQAIVVVPEFDRKAFPKGEDFNHGGVIDEQGKVTPMSSWSYSVIEPLFDSVKARTKNQSERYRLYGHSAGSQFVHRFNYFISQARCDLLIAANAGSYAMPDFNTDYPFGLNHSGLDETALKQALGRPMVILLGTEDKDPNHPQLPRQSEAMKQGPHRLARGEAFYKQANAQAKLYQIPLGWRLEYVPDVAHQNSKMSLHAAPILFSGP